MNQATNLSFESHNLINYIHNLGMTKGLAVISTFMHTPAKCRIFKGKPLSGGHLSHATAGLAQGPDMLD